MDMIATTFDIAISSTKSVTQQLRPDPSPASPRRDRLLHQRIDLFAALSTDAQPHAHRLPRITNRPRRKACKLLVREQHEIRIFPHEHARRRGVRELLIERESQRFKELDRAL
jgi:hypothetical protein